VDWLILWLLIGPYLSAQIRIPLTNSPVLFDASVCQSDKYGVLASAKAMAKKVIRFFPVIGWAYYFNEFIFLERQWDKDKDTLCRGLDNFLTFTKPVTVLMFCEGTVSRYSLLISSSCSCKSFCSGDSVSLLQNMRLQIRFVPLPQTLS
jgi:1-acyl-sn-glycerol-3-phosphate acyltransferase